jgi:hypothetical protein
MARWNKQFAQITSVASRPLPASVYEKGKASAGITLADVKKEIKALIDLMEKRYKAAIKGGAEHVAVEKYERGYWDKPSTIWSVQEGVKQIREMWKTITETGSAREVLQRQEEEYNEEYEGLMKKGWFDDSGFSYSDFYKFRRFFGIYKAANKEAWYYKVLQDYIANLYGETEKAKGFRKQDIAQLLKRWDYWEQQSEEAGKKARDRLRSGTFVPADTIRRW